MTKLATQDYVQKMHRLNEKEWEISVLNGSVDDKPNKNIIYLVTSAERQAFCDYLFREQSRHKQDIDKITQDLEKFAKEGIFPRPISVDDYIKV